MISRTIHLRISRLTCAVCLFGAVSMFGLSYATEPADATDALDAAADVVVDKKFDSTKNDEADTVDTHPIYNRRVLLPLFLNEQKNPDAEYLSLSIPETFSKQLYRTGKFVILNRDSVHRHLATMNINQGDLWQDENCVRLGRAIGADVVVVGRFQTEGERATIEAKAIDVRAGRMSVEDREVIPTNTSMFDHIDRLVVRMSGPMAEKMQPLETPPPPAEIVLTEEQVVAEVKKIEEKKAAEKGEALPPPAKKFEFTVRAGGTFVVSLGYTKTVYPIGFGAMVGGEILGLTSLFFKQDWLRSFEVGLFSGYLIYPPKHNSYGVLSQIPLHGSVGYRFDFAWFGGVAVTPLFSMGMDFGKFSNINGATAYRIFAWSAGGRAEYAISERWSTALTTCVLFEYDQGLNYQWVNFLSAGVRW
ncbi:MAG: hypothetical protein LDLANPLL_02584 [Turneriella sp.]|nr:hypothetical protein [Turneriella sp.]